MDMSSTDNQFGKQKREKNKRDEDIDNIYDDFEENLDDFGGIETHKLPTLVSVTEKHESTAKGDLSLEDGVDLYGDLKSFEDHLAAEELEAKLEVAEQKCISLEQKNEEMINELDRVNKLNLQLRRNISSIFKTARSELERKEKQLKDLQSRYDTLVFRRGAQAKNAQLTISKENIVDPSTLNKGPKEGNTITLDQETNCTVKMGGVSISFTTEHFDFQLKRFERLQASMEQEKRNLEHVEQNNENTTTNLPPIRHKNIKQDSGDLEEGEVEEGARSGPPPATKSGNRASHTTRSRSRSRSPLPKRRRSPADKHRSYSQTRDRHSYERTRHPRSPLRSSSRYRNSRYDSRHRGR